MKKIALLSLLIIFTIESRADLWHISEEKEIATAGVQRLKPEKYILAKLDNTLFKNFQSSIPTEDNQNYPIIELPTPEGEVASFYIYENRTMAPVLSTRYSMIKTYTLVSTKNPHITGKADFTYWGFHANIFDGDKSFFIDPYKQGNKKWYLVYFKKDYHLPLNERMQCHVNNEHESISEIQNGATSIGSQLPHLKGQRKTFGTDKRLYRLALACTMEYSAAVGGATPTKASVLSAMVTTMNRVNGVFEREFSMTAQLISNTDDVIYLPGGTDPYTNGSGSTMLGQNHTTLTSIIGASNYDFGHVFSTGGGGIANFACVCRNSKARGVTGRNNPVGDPFDIDYVAHEMGHQFGGSHTFNSSSGSCSGNGSSSSSYEPGSGTTIMGYAGICGSNDNIQNNSDDYYHIRSLMQITNHLEGQGNCSANTPSSNTPPSLSAISQTYNIPYKTFFELEASATDADGDPITYCWEQWDLGAYGPWNTVSTGNPLFRSFAPKAEKIRMFPELTKVRNEQIKTKGEVLPEVARNLSFKVAARDIRNGYGTFNFSNDEIEIQAINTGTNLFRITSHGTIGQTWTGDTYQTVTWNTAGTESGAVNAPTVDIYLSLDGGETWPHLLLSNIPNNGTHSVLIPNVSSNIGLIKVKGHNNIFFDLNDRFIKLEAQPYPVSTADITADNISVYPNPANDYIQIDNMPSEVNALQIVSPLGAVVNQIKAEGMVDISQLASGVYYLNFLADTKRVAVKKMLIQH